VPVGLRRSNQRGERGGGETGEGEGPSDRFQQFREAGPKGDPIEGNPKKNIRGK